MGKYDQAIKTWTHENAPLGRALGYPECCIREFCNQPPSMLKNGTPSKDDKRRYKASLMNGEYTGFVPCSKHAAEIVAGKITLESLITNRDAKFPIFPNAF
jgi:hypothetical protein